VTLFDLVGYAVTFTIPRLIWLLPVYTTCAPHFTAPLPGYCVVVGLPLLFGPLTHLPHTAHTARLRCVYAPVLPAPYPFRFGSLLYDTFTHTFYAFTFTFARLPALFVYTVGFTRAVIHYLVDIYFIWLRLVGWFPLQLFPCGPLLRTCTLYPVSYLLLLDTFITQLLVWLCSCDIGYARCAFIYGPRCCYCIVTFIYIYSHVTQLPIAFTFDVGFPG